MKRNLSKFIIGMSCFGVGLIALPSLTSCSSIDDLQKIDRGDGSSFASFGNDFKITFNDQIIDALTNKTSYSAYKTQYVNHLLYKFYKKIVDSEKLQSFNDDWSKWNNDIDEEYDNKVKESKSKHGSTWEFYFQNEVLDPDGGTKESWKYNQLCSKIREDFKSKVFKDKYLAYSNVSEYNVNNDIISTFDKQIFFENPAEWRKINFYAKNKAGGNYNTDKDLDDVYALIQKLAFEMFTGTSHPISVSMCLWKYKAPETSKGLLDIYSDKITKNSTKNSSYIRDDEGGGDDDGGGGDDSSVAPGYEFPAFPEYNGTPSPNGKFWYVIRNLLLDNNNHYGLTPTGFSNIPNDKWYTDDSATQIVVNTNDLSSLDPLFGGSAVNLWANYSNSQFVQDKLLKYDISNLLANPDSGKETDILRNFFFRSNDKRLFSSGSLTALGRDLANCDNKIDLSAIYESQGDAGKLRDGGGSNNFHSKIFRSQSPLFFDYYGDNTEEGGVQWVVSALRLYDGNTPLPYILIRDEISEGGVHIIGLNGAVCFDNDGNVQSGYLANGASADNDNTQPFSQGRENILLKAQYLWEKGSSSTTIDLESKVQSFFSNDDNFNNIVISMAKNQTRRENDNQAIIFPDDGLLNNVDREPFYDLFTSGNNFFSTQSTISAIDSQNKRLFDKKYSNVQKSLISRSTSLSKIGQSNYSNGMSTPYPFRFVEVNDVQGYVSSLVSYDINNIMAWTCCDLYDYDKENDVWNRKEITFNEVKNQKQSYIELVTDLTRNIKPYIQTAKPEKYSEHIYNKWDKDDALSTCVYAALKEFGSNESFSNNVKIKAMRNYVKSCFGNESIVSDFDSFNGYATIGSQNLNNAFISQYITNALLSSKPLSTYQSMSSVNNISQYASSLNNSFKYYLNRSFANTNYSSDMYEYLLVLDAMQYLIKDNYANLIDYLKNNVIRYGEDGNIVWVSKENTNCVPSFNVDGETTLRNRIDTFFNYKNNYIGQYSNTYFHNGDADDTPSSFVENAAYYKFAPIPVENTWDDAMGYVGLITSTDTTSPITTSISDQIFKNAYYTKRTGTGENDRKGGWYKYGDWDTLLQKINICSGIKDITDLVDNLSNDLSEPGFTRYVKAIVSRSFYEVGDPEVEEGSAKLGEPISLSVLKERLIGEKSMYYNLHWGLTRYKEDHETLVDNMFLPFGNKNSVAEICDGGNVQNIDHTIKVSDDDEHIEARVLVLQLNNNDVSSYENLYAALGGNDYSKELIDMLVVQYAMTSSIKNLALQDVIKVNFKGEKITVYDRRFNDNLGRTWVKDWKSTN